ncbi:MAG: hypothetical protein JWL79_2829 [Frankiales bacterium]|nr:hypothetical protein [Frankiales bacterium]
MRSLAPALLLLPLLAACTDATGCTATTMTASDATKVDLKVLGSAVLRARLTAKGTGVAGKTIVFTLRAGDSDVFRGESSARADGTASLDLKSQLNASALLAVVRATAFTASFPGDTTYCSSADDAAFRTL